MFQLMLPYVIGLALGIDPGEPAPAEATDMMAAVAGSGDDAALRDPEPQVPTGKYTTAVEVRPILQVTRGNWVAVRDFNGQDLVYFTNLLSWRCGLWDIRYGINGNLPEMVLPMEPCHADTSTPNALVQIDEFLPYIALPQGSVDSVTVEIVYDDGTSESASFERAEVLLP